MNIYSVVIKKNHLILALEHTIIFVGIPKYISVNNILLVQSTNMRAISWQNHQNHLCTQWRLRSAWASAQSDHRPVWSETSLSSWRNLGFLATHWAHSEDWSDWADAKANLNLRWAHRLFCWFCHAAAHHEKVWTHMENYRCISALYAK